MRKLVLLLTLFLFKGAVKAYQDSDAEAFKSKSTILETLYNNKDYSTLKKHIKKYLKEPNLSENLNATIYRLQGHLCFFGMEKDSYIDLPCAWRNYLVAAKLNDAEGLFYSALMIRFYIFDSLEPLREMFPRIAALVDSAETKELKFIKLESFSESLHVQSAAEGFPLAKKYLLMKTPRTCEALAAEFSLMIKELLPHFENFYPFETKNIRMIMTMLDLTKTKEEPSVLYTLRFLELEETIEVIAKELKVDKDVWLATSYLGLKEYELAKMQAAKLLEKDANDKYAHYILGVLYLHGLSVPVDYNTARWHLQKSVDADYLLAFDSLAYMYLKGLGVPQDLEKARKLARMVSKENFGVYMALGNTRLDKASLETLISSVVGEKAETAYNFAKVFLEGIGIKKDCTYGAAYLDQLLDSMLKKRYFNRAYELYQRGNVRAAAMQYLALSTIINESVHMNIGNIFDKHKVIRGRLWIHDVLPDIDINKYIALKGYLDVDAVKMESVRLRIGDFYYYGHGTEKNLTKAMEYYDQTKAMDDTGPIFASALFNHGLLHQYGIGVPQNYEVAAIYYQASSFREKGFYYPVCIMNLVMTYEIHGIKGILPSFNKPFFLIALSFLVLSLIFILLRKSNKSSN